MPAQCPTPPGTEVRGKGRKKDRRTKRGQARLWARESVVGVCGWGQIEHGSWKSTDEPDFQPMRQLVHAAIEPLPYHDIAGTCGRNEDCRCLSCWVRKAKEERQRYAGPVRYRGSRLDETSKVFDRRGALRGRANHALPRALGRAICPADMESIPPGAGYGMRLQEVKLKMPS